MKQFPCPFADEPLLTITQKPVKTSTGKGNHQWQFLCSDGKTRNLLELSYIAKIAQPSMHQRLKDHGWDHPEILARRIIKKKDKFCDLKRGLFAGLKNRSRDGGLGKIPHPSTFEMNLL